MDEKMISLCISYPSWGDPDRQMLFRIADYNLEEDFMHQVPFDSPEYADGAKKIGFHPKDAYPYMAELREWKYDEEDSNKTRSYFYSKNIYEIVFLPELEGIDYFNSGEIRRILCGGFTLDESASENLLLSIGQQGKHYSVLQCRKKDLRHITGNLYAFSSDIRDMIHAMHYLKEYDILDSQIISTDNQCITLANGKAAIRYFYNSTTLPEQVGIFHIVDFSKYIPFFVSNYLKKNKEIFLFNSNDIRKITDLLQVIFADQKHREDFFSCTGFTTEKLAELLPKYRSLLAELLLNDSSVETIIKNSLLKDESIWNQCVELVRKEWLSEQDDEKAHIQGELQTLKKEKEDFEALLATSVKEKEKLDADIALIGEQLTNKKSELLKIQDDIETELTAFSENIVHSTAVCAVAQKFAGGNNIHNDNTADIIVITPDIDEKPDPLENCDDFQEALADNLMSIGYDESIVDAMAQLITYSIITHMPLLLSGNEENVSQCISAMLGKSVVVLNISNNDKPTNYLDSLESKVENAPVILVNGAFSGMSVEHFNAIKYHFSNKGHVVLFSIDGADVDMLPKCIIEKTMFLDCQQGINPHILSTLNGYKVDLTKLNLYVDETVVTEQLTKLEPFITSGIINRLIAINYAKFMTHIDCNIEKDWLLILQICVYAKATNKTEPLAELLSDMGINFEVLKYYL